MHFRERLKKTFRRASHSDAKPTTTTANGATTTTTTTPTTTAIATAVAAAAKPNPDPPASTYKPGEKLPPPKYRRPVDKQHKELLEAFSFNTAWRRKSSQSQYSPMGSRAPSRKNSAEAQVGRRSTASRFGDGPVHEPHRVAGEAVAEDEEGSGGESTPRGTGVERDDIPVGAMDPMVPRMKDFAIGGPSENNQFMTEEAAPVLQRSHLEVPS
ncbi:hypothetical protein EJ06DRAFT_237809 [Trichodelitschia bisporula]|uniref:Uncharacterized protein n=1 Tax=Trichodelitschia bisporula TaxID=703511 RepID=A0A6G1HK77_9PEZI|nr:hypothetical protein EJ06DRAFT_237809 [Trichodelitschia bisporula]